MLKIVLVFSEINLFSAYVSSVIKGIGHENAAFSVFMTLAIVLRLSVYMLFREKKHRNRIQYFELSKYKGILTRFIFVFVFMILMISLALSEGIGNGKSNIVQLRVTLLLLLILLLLSIYENVEEVVGDFIEKMRQYQQEEIKQNYLEGISEKTKELSKIKHDIKDHMFMVNYLVEQGNLDVWIKLYWWKGNLH